MKDSWRPAQRHAVVACVAAWMLDAFDFFILVFILSDIADAFSSSVETLSYAIMLTLAVRPIGALIFGRAAERYGRKPVLIVNIVLFSVFELASGLAPGLISLFVIRAFYGIAMGGVWGVASSLAMESIPAHARGFVSGLFQAGYPAGYLVASIVYGLLFSLIGWRGLFFVGIAPALLAVYVHFCVEESPVWRQARAAGTNEVDLWDIVRRNARFVGYAVVLMAAFNFFSHGTQDIYPTFLKIQHGLDAHQVSLVAICYNIAAILGGVAFGALSQRIGRRPAIIAAALGSLVVVYPWAYAQGLVWLAASAFAMQFMVQGAWGVVPAYLNESAPAGSRAVLPGFVYQVGNFVAAADGPLQTSIAGSRGGNYSLALFLVAAIVAVAIAICALLGRESRGRELTQSKA
ncbi:MFS transporter [Salinisphaera sp. Q1T1-3]|uniref:MFS transporter n=1 Tax=Salinisphaera sp. Q1T1-3 TaxID=2321229 RepID=UPI000E76DECD|nr:MFS transporter [Salinisphaera sp. Q1T1-3]RJS95402.1 MFS transporter [Salinisphaera sp. Q1T1-3]